MDVEIEKFLNNKETKDSIAILKDKMVLELFNAYFKDGFGLVSKPELDRLMFHYYYMIKQMDPAADLSDYTLSHELMITQQRVRNFKLKDRLFYPEAYDKDVLKRQFARCLVFARYDESSKMLIVPVEDPCVFEEIQHEIESAGGYLDLTLNTKILKARIEYVLSYIVKNELTITDKELIKAVKQSHKIELKCEKSVSPMITYSEIVKGVGTLTDFLSIIKDFINPGNIMFNTLSKLIVKK